MTYLTSRVQIQNLVVIFWWEGFEELHIVLVECFVGHKEVIGPRELVPVGVQDFLIDASVQQGIEQLNFLWISRYVEVTALPQELEQSWKWYGIKFLAHHLEKKK